MTTYISLVQQKGGVGKSTIAYNLCGYFLSKGFTVLAVDGDMPQGTLSASLSLVENENLNCKIAESAKELSNILEDANDEYDIVITDTPPRISDITNIALYVSDLVLVPVTTNTPDLWSAQDLIETTNERFKNESIKPNVFILWNKYLQKSNVSKEIRSEFMESFKENELKSHLSNYLSFSRVMGMGKFITNFNHTKSKTQFCLLGKEIEKLLK